MREKVLEEILATEKSYVKTLQDIIQVYQLSIRVKSVKNCVQYDWSVSILQRIFTLSTWAYLLLTYVQIRLLSVD